MEQNILLAVTPGRITTGGSWGLPLAHLAYRVGGGPHLYRAKGPVQPQRGWMVIDDTGFDGGGEARELCGEILRECTARGFSGVLCRFQGRPWPVLEEAVASLSETCKARGLGCFVTEPYAAQAPAAGVVLSTAVSGGSLKARLEEARHRYGRERLGVWLDRAAEDFLLPSPTGTGAPLTGEELERRRKEHGADVFFSPELCQRYFTYMAGEKGHFVLFDDAGTLGKKLRLARSLGAGRVFLPYDAVEDLLPALLEELAGDHSGE